MHQKIARNRTTATIGALLAMTAAAALVGCGDTMRPLTAADFPLVGANEHGHRSAHGGVVASVGSSNHVEALVEPTMGRIRLFVMGEDETELFPIPAESLAAEASASDGKARVLALKAMPQPGEPAGFAAEFAGALLLGFIPANLTITLPLNGKRHRVRLPLAGNPEQANGENGSGYSEMPADVVAAPLPPSRAERELFLTPGGRYTEQDIRANGGQTAPQKFRGLMSQHNADPPKGTRICPISRTQASQRFAWTIGGKRYLFCCPPCVGEFVRQAKEKPDTVRVPEEYVKQ